MPKLVIDPNKTWNRHRDAYFSGRYPKKINHAEAILVKLEDTMQLPQAIRMPDELPDMSTFGRALTLSELTGFYTNPHVWGRIFYFTLLRMHPISEKVLIADGGNWDFAFLPGEYPLGKISQQTDISFRVTGDIIYDSLMLTGLKTQNMAASYGDYLNYFWFDGKPVLECYTKNRLNAEPHDTSDKVILVEDLLQDNPYQNNPYAGWDQPIIFRPKKKFESICRMLNYFAEKTGNVVWRLAELDSDFCAPGLPPFRRDQGYYFFSCSKSGITIDLGYTGREIETGIIGDQLESIRFRVRQPMVLSALADVEDDLHSVHMRKHWESPWEEINLRNYTWDKSRAPL